MKALNGFVGLGLLLIFAVVVILMFIVSVWAGTGALIIVGLLLFGGLRGRRFQRRTAR